MFCRHYHRAMWSERCYKELLSDSAAAPVSRAQRKLSSAFESVVASRGSTSRHYSPSLSNREPSLGGHLNGTSQPTDPLQASSDSVFEQHWDQPGSPQVLRGSSKPNPLTSYTNYSKFRPAAAAQASAGEANGHISRRTSSISGPLATSATATGHKNRTPSGMHI